MSDMYSWGAAYDFLGAATTAVMVISTMAVSVNAIVQIQKDDYITTKNFLSWLAVCSFFLCVAAAGVGLHTHGERLKYTADRMLVQCGEVEK